MGEKNVLRAQEEGKDTWEPKDEAKIGKKGDEFISYFTCFFYFKRLRSQRSWNEICEGGARRKVRACAHTRACERMREREREQRRSEHRNTFGYEVAWDTGTQTDI